jgi:hypothetical protein
MAPNQRDPNKHRICVWLEKDRVELFRKRAESLGMTMTEVITAHIVSQTTEYLKKNGNKNKNSN